MGESFLDQADEDQQDDEVEVESGKLEDPETAPVPVSPDDDNRIGVVKPVTDDLSEVEESYQSFKMVKSTLLDAQDISKINKKPHINKSGWRKIATAFGVSTNVTSKERSQEDGIVKWTIIARAEAPNGQAANGVGMCASNESNFTEKLSEKKAEKPESPLDGDIVWVDGAWRRVKPPQELKEHDIFATAATRAKNRAISDLVGGGEVSVEEMDSSMLL